jgi:hypothetical protein
MLCLKHLQTAFQKMWLTKSVIVARVLRVNHRDTEAQRKPDLELGKAKE